jgi:hypothetical protein
MIRNVTPEELASLKAFANHYGRSWKRKLAEVYWYNARIFRDDAGVQHHSLHGLRNDPRWGFEGLDAFQFPK